MTTGPRTNLIQILIMTVVWRLRIMIPVRTKTIQLGSTKDRHIPVVIKWKGVSMIRNQSFYAAIDDIINWSETLDVTRIGLVGDPHSGKSTLAEAIAHK